MNITMRISIILLAVLLMPVSAHAGKYWQLAGKVSKEKMADVYDRLNLSAKQRAKLEANRQKNHQKMRALRKTIRQLEKQISDELSKQNIDQAMVTDLKGQIKAAQAQLTDLRLKGIMEVRKILTPEQYKTFSEMTK